MIKSLSTPDRYERAVAQYLTKFCNVKATRPEVGPKYPDVKVEYQGNESWIEVKMNEQDQMGGPRVRFDGKQWVSKDSPIQNFVCKQLNKSPEFIDKLSSFLKKDFIKIPSTMGGLKDPAAVPFETLEKFFNDEDDLYIYREEGVNLGDLITQHYNFGKSAAAHYIQAGDQFFALGLDNPFGLDIPVLEGEGIFKVRIQFRQTNQFYEVIPEIKLRNEIYSPYSIAPGTLKPHPF